jgi:hypothetical protein
MKYVANILGNLSEEKKFRLIRLSNKTFTEKVLNTKGGLELMLSIGFCPNQSHTESGVTNSLSKLSTDSLIFPSKFSEQKILTSAFSLLDKAADEVYASFYPS